MDQAEDAQRMHRMRIHDVVGCRRMQIIQIGFDHIQSSGHAVPLGHIQEDDRRVIVLKGERQVVATNSEIHNAHVGRNWRHCQAAGHFAAEGVVAAKDIADAGDENARRHSLISSTGLRTPRGASC